MDKKIKIYLVIWCSGHDGNVDNGAIPCHTKEEAYNELNTLYLQGRVNVEPPYSCDDFDDTTYFVQSEDGLDWERGEILEKDF